jgi:ferredoxin-type protein NapH
MRTTNRRQILRTALIIGSFILFPITIFYFSPVLIVMAAATGILSGSAIVFFFQFLSALFLGRVFCGWICPAGGQQEACFIGQIKPVNGRRCDWIKYLIWVPWITTIIFLLIRNGIRSTEFFFMMDSPISLSSPGQYPVYIIVTGVIFILSLAVGRRAFCHTGCWMAPFMIAGIKAQHLLNLPALHLRSAPEKCVKCRVCASECPMSLDVTHMVRHGDMRNNECILCGSCADVCKAKAISYAFGINEKPKKPAGGAA